MEDEAAVHAYASDPLVTRFLVWGPDAEEDTRRFIAEAIGNAESPERKTFDLAVVEKQSQTLVGGAAIRVVDADGRHGEIGYVFRRDVWSRGYATETAKSLVRFGFGTLRLRHISATCDPANVASARVLEKTGLAFVKHVPVLVRGENRDSLLFACSPSDD